MIDRMRDLVLVSIIITSWSMISSHTIIFQDNGRLEWEISTDCQYCFVHAMNHIGDRNKTAIDPAKAIIFSFTCSGRRVWLGARSRVDPYACHGCLEKRVRSFVRSIELSVWFLSCSTDRPMRCSSMRTRVRSISDEKIICRERREIVRC